MEIVVRHGCMDDVSAVARLSAVVQDSHARHSPSRFKPGDVRSLETWLESTLGDPKTLLWVAECPAGIVGYVLVFERHQDESAFTHARDWYFIEQIAVDPAWQRKGVAARLLAALDEHAADIGISEFELNSWCFNDDAHQAFRALGFTPQRVMFSRRTDGRRQ